MKLTAKATIRAPWGQGGENSALDLFNIDSIGEYRDSSIILQTWESVESEDDARFKARGWIERIAGKEPSAGVVSFSFAILEEGKGTTREAKIEYVRMGNRLGRFILDHSALFKGYVSRKKGYLDPREHKGAFRKDGVIIEWDKCNHASARYSIREYYIFQPMDAVGISLDALDPWRWRACK